MGQARPVWRARDTVMEKRRWRAQASGGGTGGVSCSGHGGGEGS